MVKNTYNRGDEVADAALRAQEPRGRQGRQGRPIFSMIAETTKDGDRQRTIDAEMEKWLRSPPARRCSERELLRPARTVPLHREAAPGAAPREAEHQHLNRRPE
jgi:hypothetical protein